MYIKKSIVAYVLILCSVLSVLATSTADVDAAKKRKSAKTTEASESRDEGFYTEDDISYLAAIIYCEAGDQSYAGKVAVGCVVMNRVASKSFPNTILSVIKQKGQFSPVRQGKFARELNNVKKGKYKRGGRRSCLKAAQEVLEGQRDIVYRGRRIAMKKYHFFSMRLSNAKLRIGGHDFK